MNDLKDRNGSKVHWIKKNGVILNPSLEKASHDLFLDFLKYMSY